MLPTIFHMLALFKHTVCSELTTNNEQELYAFRQQRKHAVPLQSCLLGALCNLKCRMATNLTVCTELNTNTGQKLYLCRKHTTVPYMYVALLSFCWLGVPSAQARPGIGTVQSIECTRVSLACWVPCLVHNAASRIVHWTQFQYKTEAVRALSAYQCFIQACCIAVICWTCHAQCPSQAWSNGCVSLVVVVHHLTNFF